MEITRTLLECIRENVRDTLGLLADTAAQNQYEWNSKTGEVTPELLTIWTEATYIRHNAAFERAFTPPELADLATFDNVIRAAAEEIGTPPGHLRELQTQDAWQRVMRSAATTLRRMRKTLPE